MIKFAIPGMYELRELNFAYLDLMRTHPEYFYPDIKVDICYGNPQFCEIVCVYHAAYSHSR